MGKLGFGAYRISIRSKEHAEALKLALEQGISLIDTSANYSDGESEQLIGKLLAEHKGARPSLVTKGGYIQGQNLNVIEELHDQNKALDDLVDLGPELKHSIHPDFLADQIQRSRQRLKVDKLDYYLLHNPEYFFKSTPVQMGTLAPEQARVEYYRRIKLAFEFLETQVQKGVIGAYGVSSNTLPLDPSALDTTSLEELLAAAEQTSSKHHFKMIQFPMNLVENQAMQGYDGGLSLIDRAREAGLLSLANRPLNAFSSQGLLRLASYEWLDGPSNPALKAQTFERCWSMMETQWQKAQAQSDEGDALKRPLAQVPMIEQFCKVWDQLPSPDAVDQVFLGHLFPFLAQIWGGSLSTEDSQPFYQLYELAKHSARHQLSKKARDFFQQAQKMGLIQGLKPDSDLAPEVLKLYLSWGVDYVLLGMRKPAYVGQVAGLF